MDVRVSAALGMFALALCTLGCDPGLESAWSPWSADASARHDGMDGAAGDVAVGDTLSASDEVAVTDSGSVEETSTSTDAGGPEPEPSAPPAFSHLDALIDAHRGATPVWASFVHVTEDGEGAPSFHPHGYGDTADRVDFWPASVIKVYTAVSALVLIKALGVGLDAQATFYRRASAGDPWTEDITRSFRDMIHGSFNCSSNTDYTLLLRFAGIDWLNTVFFTEAEGFTDTALMVGYTNSRPWRYLQSEEQRIVVTEGGVSHERVHLWGGDSYAQEVGCAIYYTSSPTANCSSPADMAEHVRRIVFHEALPAAGRFDVRQDDIVWLRDGGDTLQMSNKGCSTPWPGIAKVFPDADYHHKGGLVGSYALGVHHVHDVSSGARYVLALVTEASSTSTLVKLSEEIARMALTPHHYVHLDTLADWVNPVTADLMVYSEGPGVLELMVKPFEEAAASPEGWEPLPGATVDVPAGLSWQALTSGCLDTSGKRHVRGRLTPDEGEVAWSDLHYVIVDADVACP